MNRAYNVLPECHADTLLIDLIGFKNPNHQPSIGAVANTMKDKMEKQLAIGVVDDDKRTPKYFEKFEIVESKDGLIRKKHPDNKHHIIVLQPAFEDWIFNAADDLGIDPKKYGISNKKYFRKITKDQNVHKNDNVKQFLNAIKQKKGSPMNTLKKWIDEILK